MLAALAEDLSLFSSICVGKISTVSDSSSRGGEGTEEEGKGREGKEREGKGREGKGREGK